ncbi:MAG: OadG family protein [Treponema sp.]|jgi:oxaloacetate decarboxylase gamma subunit|nr:OadG family protein [Treponema sp.]
MTIFKMLEQSGVLALLGMGFVFSFLIILIMVVSLTGAVIRALALDRDAQGPVKPGAVLAGSAKSAALAAAITAAITEYRKENP